MGKPIAEEISKVEGTIRWAFEQDILELHRLFFRWADEPLVIVGSGGSYSVAAAWAQLHRQHTGEAATSITPLFLESVLRDQSARRVLLISAEGKNNDILQSAQIARAFDVPTAAITLTRSNPLLDYAATHRSLFSFAFEFDCKDGYLATNSLIATIILAGRAYKDVKGIEEIMPPILAIADRRAELRKKVMRGFGEHGVIVLFGPDTALFAIDLESKLSESAFAQCQIADYRQFAHGRHLQLDETAMRTPTVLAAFSDTERQIAEATIANFPRSIQLLMVPIGGESSTEIMLACALEAILITEAFGHVRDRDPGQPQVPDFGRSIYALDVAQIGLQPQPRTPFSAGVIRKTRCQNLDGEARLTEEADRYIQRLNSAYIKGIVFDFDGTLCDVHERFSGVREDVAAMLSTLLNNGIAIGIATGRGDSVIAGLRAHIPEKHWSKLFLGLYSGSQIGTLAGVGDTPGAHPEFDEVIAHLNLSSLKCVLDANQPNARAGQLDFRIGNHRVARELAREIEAWIHRTGRIGWRVFSSGHSVDLLAPNASKLNVCKAMQQTLGIDPQAQLLRLGDAGEMGGNDFELLAEGLSLSVERTSASTSACWNFSPPGVRQADATLYYLRQLTISDGFVTLRLPNSQSNQKESN